jgi:hypothetical protein
MERLLHARIAFILLTIRPHEQNLRPSKQAERISHRLGPPALLCREASPTLLEQARGIGTAPVWRGPRKLKRRCRNLH